MILRELKSDTWTSFMVLFHSHTIPVPFHFYYTELSAYLSVFTFPDPRNKMIWNNLRVSKKRDYIPLAFDIEITRNSIRLI